MTAVAVVSVFMLFIACGEYPVGPPEKRFTVSYSLNGGSGSTPSSRTVKAGNDFYLPSGSGFSRSGFTFGGWNTNSSGTGTNYNAGSSFTPSSNITLYARWTSTSSQSAIVLSLNTPASVSISSGTRREVRFTASTSGTYRFESSNQGSLDPTAYTALTGGNVINDDGGSGNNYMFQQTLSAGQTYTYWSGVYNNSSTGSYTVTVTLVGSSGSGIVDGGTLSYGGQNYRTVIIGGKRWMAENLNYAGSGGNVGVCYLNRADSCAKYGRLYTWAEAMNISSSYNSSTYGSGSNVQHQGICPSGWRLPNDNDWDNLVSLAGGSSTAGSKLKSQSGWWSYSGISSTDEFGFSALPGGSRTTDGSFVNVGNWGYWWSATEGDASNARHRYTDYNNSNVNSNWLNKSNGFSVRCSQD